MTLSLDLSKKQQDQIKPLIRAQIASKKEIMLNRKEIRTEKKRPSRDEIYAMKSKQLDNQITFKNNLKDILNKEQFEKFRKMKKEKGMKIIKKKKMTKEGKIERE